MREMGSVRETMRKTRLIVVLWPMASTLSSSQSLKLYVQTAFTCLNAADLFSMSREEICGRANSPNVHDLPRGLQDLHRSRPTKARREFDASPSDQSEVGGSVFQGSFPFSNFSSV